MASNRTFVHRRLILEISGCSAERFSGKQIPQFIESKAFPIVVNGEITEWSLQLRPNCYAGNMCLFLDKKHLNDYDIYCQAGIRNKADKYIGEKIATRNKGKKLILARISHVELFDPTNEYIAESKLTIFCELVLTTGGRSAELAGKEFKASASEYSKMFDRGLKDCELHMNGKVLQCHKVILAARSDVFYTTFTVDMVEARNNIVDIEDIEFETIVQLVRFCYDLPLEGLDQIAHKLIYAADKYQIKELKKICFESLSKNLKRENVLEYLTISERIAGSSQLYEDCADLIVSCSRDLIGTPEWKSLSQETVSGLLLRVLHRCNPFVEMSDAKTLE